MNSILSFQPSGLGKIIITASEAMQYVFDGKHVEGQTQNSLFTRFLIEGLQTGIADSDNDGLVDIDELYQFAYKHITPQQTPNISSTSQEGRMYIGLNPNPKVRLAQLPDHLLRVMNSEDRYQRQGAVLELARLLMSPDPAEVMAAEMALRIMAKDDSRLVADAVQEALDHYLKPKKEITQPQPPIQRTETSKSQTTATATPPVSVTPAPPSTVVTTNVPPIAVGIFPKKQKNPKLGGFLNIIIPGGARAYVGNWGRAVLTFVVVTVMMYLIASNSSLGVCTSVLVIEMIYMFIAGRNIVIKRNKKLSNYVKCAVTKNFRSL